MRASTFVSPVISIELLVPILISASPTPANSTDVKLGTSLAIVFVTPLNSMPFSHRVIRHPEDRAMRARTNHTRAMIDLHSFFKKPLREHLSPQGYWE